jgi:pantoate kinase
MSKYWVASHITGIFTIHDEHPDPLFRGSRGAGFSISRGTTTTVEYSDDKEHHIYFNEEEMDREIANVTNNVLNHFLVLLQAKNKLDFGLSIFHEIEVPLSCGFGASASAAIGTAFALRDLLGLEIDEKYLYGVAHIAEINEGGGLGDVLAIYQGGWEMRKKEGAPFIGDAINLLENEYKIATLSMGEIATKSVIKNPSWKEKINNVGGVLLDNLSMEPTIQNFTLVSQQFSITSFLATPEIIELMKEIEQKDVLVAQTMLGNGIFILYKDGSDLPDLENLVKEEICFSTIKKI